MSFPLTFSKYQGTGNDFIIIDGRGKNIPSLSTATISKLCDRKFGIGADGLIILNNRPGYDFEMDFYNSDGKHGSMCGNGGRCIVAFAHDLGIIHGETCFWAPDGEHKAIYHRPEKVSLLMSNVKRVEYHPEGIFMDTGSPHLVIFKDVKDFKEAFEIGKTIRYNERYAKDGINVNFAKVSNNSINVVTYERGVEDVTLSCGTGTVASVLAAHLKYKFQSPVKALTPGGELFVEFTDLNNESFTNIFLIWPAKIVFQGVIEI